jgi:hypothetical protein
MAQKPAELVTKPQVERLIPAESIALRRGALRAHTARFAENTSKPRPRGSAGLKEAACRRFATASIAQKRPKVSNVYLTIPSHPAEQPRQNAPNPPLKTTF